MDRSNPPALDLSRWAVVAHNDDTGFGRMAADIRRLLGLGYHLVIPSERLDDRPLTEPTEQFLDPKAPDTRVRELLTGLQGIIFFERHSWHQSLLPIAQSLGVRTVCVPMWEWFRGNDAQWQYCDLFICPTRYTVQVVQGYGWKNAVYLPWLLDITRFAACQIAGPARLFIHNAGLVDHDDRKGTRDTILAFKQVRRSDIRLLVRIQKEVPLPALDERIEVQVGNLDDPTDLYRHGDVAIQPSKMEGIGFMVLEAVCSGLPVITTDYPPMSEFVQQPELRVKPRWFKRKAFATQWIKHAHLRLPQTQDLARKIAWCADHDLAAISKANRAWTDATFAPETLKRQWQECLTHLLVGRMQR
ncbi:glycosyltransferase [Anthocerotibacter panamensis]|uniref:glycosyltransferase n=1 Tax=Anthocerotibacter panamensis TaxID=2857077 RepID=UPI001C404F83|nr:glycosyltransferase [Anthocerotibacter panamensis]